MGDRGLASTDPRSNLKYFVSPDGNIKYSKLR